MIPIIRNSSRFMDTNIGFNFSGIITAKNGNTLASMIASMKDSWDEQIADLIETYTDSEEDTVA